MVDIAREAYQQNNYVLAAEIYERNIRDSGGNRDLYISLGNSLSHSLQFRKAFEAYRAAFMLANGHPDELNELVEALINMVKQREDLTAKPEKDENVDMFSCDICKAILTDPVTISCGHSFCRKCLEKDKLNECKKCGKTPIKGNKFRHKLTKTNVLLQKLTEEWFPKETKVVLLKDDGNRHFSHNRLKESIESYSEALKHDPCDHLIVSNRSHAYAVLEQYQQALDDAELAIRLRPDWPKAYYRKGAALAGLLEHEDAAFAYLQCLSLDPSISPAKVLLAKELHHILSTDATKHTDLEADIQSALSPSLLARKHACVLARSSVLNVSSLEELKSGLREKLLQSGDLFPKIKKVRSRTLSPCSKNVSAPSSRPDSPVSSPRLPQRAISDQTMQQSVKKVLELDAKMSRKRSSEDISTPSSYVKSPSKTSPKLAKSDKPDIVYGLPVRPVDAEKLKPEDFECSLCFRLLYMPVTTPCGHTFCRQCLDRCLDHTTECPLCKGSLTEYLAERRQVVTEALDAIIQTYFPKQYAEREKLYRQEMEDVARILTEKECEIPIFVCTLAFPSVTCPLHVFEPRYRLMIRRCMESGTRQFGMCITLDGNEDNFSDYGTLLEVRDVQYFPDGRSVVDTVGAKRFKVLSRGLKDGYHTAKVEFLKDNQIPAEEKSEVEKLCHDVFQEAKAWFGSLTAMPRGRILQYFGAFPELEPNFTDHQNGPSWIWWMTAVLPLDQRAQITILAMNSLKERLLSIRRVLNFVQRKGSS